jgi:hypothetical protein
MDNDTGADPVEGGNAVVRSTWPTLSLGHLGVVQTINTSGLNALPDDQHVGFERTARTIKK